jgi:hypothetical protein
MGKTHPPDTENNGPKELVRLCRAGRLYEIERWINDGKSLEIPASTKRGRQRTLLEIAVETGFHSLVELIAEHEASQSEKNAALYSLVESHEVFCVIGGKRLRLFGPELKAQQALAPGALHFAMQSRNVARALANLAG